MHVHGAPGPHLAVGRARDTAIAVEVYPLSGFLPSASHLIPIEELFLDFSGESLGLDGVLSIADPGLGLTEDDVVLVAKVVRLDGIPYLTVVALAALQGERIVSQAYPGLPGITEGGRYVFYRSTAPIGFVAGRTLVSGAAVKAVVGTEVLPFVDVARPDGSYIVAAATGGGIALDAFVPATALQAAATADVDPLATTPLDIVLAGIVTTASVAPQDGAVQVPTNVQVELTTSAPLNPATVVAENVRLLRVGESGDTPVPVRLVLSGSGRILAVVPQQALAWETTYRFESAGLTDVYGGVVAIAPATFTTKADTPPVYDLTAIVFGYPDENGIVTITAPAGTLPPGTSILIINAGNGVVVTLTAGNDGQLNGEIPASIHDQLYVTVTDPFGNVATFTRSEYVAPDGSVGIGPGGGTVHGPGGVELRIPEGALDKGVTFKIEGLAADAFDALFPGQKPSLGTDASGNPLGTMGSALKIEVDGEATFHKEIDLAFPLPNGLPENPSDAFFHVFRRLAGPEGRVVYETLDHAFVEGEGPEAKVVTASPPFAGFRAMYSGYDAFGATTSAALSYAILMWTFNDLLPGLALPGAITGKVLRAKWQEGGGSATPSYEPVPGILVWGQDAAGAPLESATQLANDTIALTQADGTFTLWDPRYVGGPVTVRAQTVVDDAVEIREATAFQIGPQDTKSLGLGAYQNVATANITFPAVEPPPLPAEVEIVVRKPDDSEAGGFVVSGTPLTLSFRSNYTVTGASVQGQAYAVVKDPQGDPELYLASEPFTPQNPGSYTISATALPPIGAAITVSRTIRVLAEGGAVDTLHDQPPAVAQVIPKAGAKGVAVNAFPQVFFTEPVRNIRDAGSGIENVTLIEDGTFGGAVPVKIGGVGPDGTVYEEVTSAQAAVTSLTIQPLVGLKYNTTYRLVISSDIEDLDEVAGQPAPKQLVAPDPVPSFTTFGPEAVGGAGDFGSPGITVLGDRAYLAEIRGAGAVADVKGFDVSDPVEPLLLPGSRTLVGRAVDIVGVEQSPITNGRMVVLATGSSSRARPANIHVLDVNSDSDFRYIGAASLTSGPIEGFIARTAVKDGLLYSATTRKGVQVVDLQQASDQFEDGGLGTLPNGTPVALQLNSDGQGWGHEAVLQTIPLWTKDNGLHYALNDIDVGDLQGQRIAVVAGEIGLLIANTLTGSYTFPLHGEAGPLSTFDASLSWGRALALGRLDDRDVVVVAGVGGTTSAGSTLLLMVVDLTNLYSPQGMGAVSLGLPSGYDVVDVILDGDTALVGVQNGAGTDGFVQIVNLAQPTQPQLAGKIDGVAGRLALTESGLLLGSIRSIFGGSSPLGGVRTAALGEIGLVTRPEVFAVDRTNKSVQPTDVSLQVVPADTEIHTAELEVYQEGLGTPRVIPLAAFSGSTTYTFPAGSPFDPDFRYEARLVVNRGLPEGELVSARQALRPAQLDIVGTQEVELIAGQDPVDIVKRFDGAPGIDLRFGSFSTSGGGGSKTDVSVFGDVVSAVAPIERVVVNEKIIDVTQTSAGPEGLGPYEGSFAATVEVGPQVELVTAYVVDALKRVSTQSLAVFPDSTFGVVTSREVVGRPALIPGSTDAAPNLFRVVLKDKGSISVREQVRVELGSGERTLTLNRSGEVFETDPLLAVPETLSLPAGAPAITTATRLPVKLGARPQLTYGPVRAQAVVEGLSVLAPDGRNAALLDPGSGSPYVIEAAVGMASAETIAVTAESLGGEMDPLGESQTFTLTRLGASDDPGSPSYNLYRTKAPEHLLALMDGFASPPGAVGKSQHIVPLGRLRLSGPTGALLLPLGPGADRVRWRTEEFSPVVTAGNATAHVARYRVDQVATFLRGEQPIPGLLISGYLDNRTTVVNDSGGVTALALDAGTRVPAPFPVLTGSDGAVRFRVEAEALDETNQPLAGVVLALTDVVGVRALERLAGVAPTTPPLGGDVTSHEGQDLSALPTTPLTAGYAGAGGVPRRHGAWYQALADAVAKQLAADPAFADVREDIRASFLARGIPLTDDELNGYYAFFLLGAALGISNGIFDAAGDSLWGVVELAGAGGAVVKFAAHSSLDAVLNVRFLADPITGTVVLVIDPTYLEGLKSKLESLLPQLRAAAALLSHEEFLAPLVVDQLAAAMNGYRDELGQLLDYLGVPPSSPVYRSMVFGYVSGAMLGYMAELGLEVVGTGGIVGLGVGAALPLIMKAGNAGGRAAEVAAAMRRFSSALLTSEGPAASRAVARMLRMLDAFGPDVLVRWATQINAIDDGPRQMIRLMKAYDPLENAASRLENMAEGLADVQSVGQTLVVMGRMTDESFRGGLRPVVVSADNAVGFVRGLGRTIDLSIAEPELASGFEAIYRSVDDVENLMVILHDAPDDSLRGASRLACPVP